MALAVVVASCGSDGTTASKVELGPAGRRGKAVAEDRGCVACHRVDGGDGTGPTWRDLAGSRVELDSGERVSADDAYLRRAVTDPKAEVTAGYADIMPSYDNLTRAELDDLLAYLHDLSTEDAAGPS